MNLNCEVLDDFLDRVICSDNAKALAAIPADCVDLVVTSPPYGELRSYDGSHTWDFITVSYHLARVLRHGGVIVWITSDQTENGSETGASIRHALHFRDNLGLSLHDTMIYHKPYMAFPRHGHRKYCGAWEYMFVLTKGRPSVFNPIKDRRNLLPGMRMTGTVRQQDGSLKPSHSHGRISEDIGFRNNVWSYDVGFMKSTKDKIAYQHPATMPEALAKDHILSWSNPGAVVADPFAGSGTTLKAAKELGRRWIGIDINPAYCEIAEKRLAQDVLNLTEALP